MNCLLLDFGTTSIKSAVLDLDTGVFSRLRTYPAADNLAHTPGHYEVSPRQLHETFLAICDSYAREPGAAFQAIAICSEQNGFVPLDERNEPMSNYVSWKDERSVEPVHGQGTYFLLTEALGDDFMHITGWRPGPGLPFFNAAHLARQSLLGSPCTLATLPEWLALACSDSTHAVHDTMLHCSGFYDVQKKAISRELVARVQAMTGVTFTFGRRAPTGAVSGYWHFNSNRIPIYVGIGDHQCAALGAANVPGVTLSVNLGTGSQVAVIDPPIQPVECEWRPYFDDRLLAAITRIPGGRAVAGYLAFLEDVCREATGHDVTFWNLAGELSEQAILDATMDMDLGIFSSAWNYSGGGRISGIHDGSFTLRTYLSGLLKSFARQYVTAARLLDPDHALKRCILSGGLARRMPVLQGILADLTGYETEPACEIDESLLGLRTTMLLAAGYASTCLEAQQIYGRECRVGDDE